MSEPLPSAETPRLAVAPVNSRMPLALLGGMLLAVGLALAAAAILFSLWPQPSSTEPDRQIAEVRRYEFPPAAPLSVRQRAERTAYFQEQQDLLSRYAWLDRERGVARIPLERAMQILADSQTKNER